MQLKSLKGDNTRPTSGKVKESIFNIIGPYFHGGIVVELFGGSGALSLEALSRGANAAYIFEKNRAACEVIRANLKKCKYEEKAQLYQTDAQNSVKILSQLTVTVNYLFIDPPYAEENFYQLAQQFIDAELLANDAVIVCEHDKSVTLPEAFGLYKMMKTNTYGNIALTIYKK